MNKLFLSAAAILVAQSAYATMPLFAAKCTPTISADSGSKGQVYVNGKVAKLIKRPDGQITAVSAGIYIDITPKGSEPPYITYTAKDKSTGVCEILSFKAPSGGSHASSSERAGQGHFDARSTVKCAQHKGDSMKQCNAKVSREAGGNATVIVTRPDGRTRAIFFENGKAIGADLSQADGSMHFKATKHGDNYHIEAGNERYEIVEAIVFGG